MKGVLSLHVSRLQRAFYGNVPGPPTPQCSWRVALAPRAVTGEGATSAAEKQKYKATITTSHQHPEPHILNIQDKSTSFPSLRAIVLAGIFRVSRALGTLTLIVWAAT